MVADKRFCIVCNPDAAAFGPRCIMSIAVRGHASVATILMFNTGPQHGEGVGEYRGDPLYHASLSPAEYEALTARFWIPRAPTCYE
jgi:hypothetical protein